MKVGVKKINKNTREKRKMHMKILQSMPVKMLFVPVKKNQKIPFLPVKNDQLGVKKVKKTRKSGREKVKVHVKKCKKTSKIGFHAHFRFHAQKKKHWTVVCKLCILCNAAKLIL